MTPPASPLRSLGAGEKAALARIAWGAHVLAVACWAAGIMGLGQAGPSATLDLLSLPLQGMTLRRVGRAMDAVLAHRGQDIAPVLLAVEEIGRAFRRRLVILAVFLLLLLACAALFLMAVLLEHA